MAERNLLAALLSLSLAAACGGSPSSPSSTSGTPTISAESAVTSAMTPAMSQILIHATTGFEQPATFTLPCASGGSTVITANPLPQQEPNLFRFSSRIEFRDCRNQTTTLNGDPYLESSAEHSFPTLAGAGGDSSSTIRTTGAIRIDSGGVQGRVQMNCTMTVTVHSVNGVAQSSLTSTGTITFEQPLGSPPVARPCGPS